MRNTKLSASSLSIGYLNPPNILNKDINLELFGGELVCLLGPNGVGKSTLMRTLSGLQKALHGNIEVLGRHLSSISIKERAKYFAVVLTEQIQLGPFRVWDLVSLGRYPYTTGFGKLTTHDQEVIKWAIRSADIYSIQDRNVNELSDGQRQRVMIARALAQEPHLLFLDEPTAFLDLPGRIEVTKLLKNLARSLRKSVLMSTHDLNLALSLADQIWLQGSDGSFQIGAPEDLVLKGAIEDVFSREGIVFDRSRGTFKSSQEFSGEVRLSGQGLARHWTEHALEREGFKIMGAEGKHALHVEVLDKGRGWISTIRGKEKEHASIYELINFFRIFNENLPNPDKPELKKLINKNYLSSRT